ncbi:MAG: FAD-dependent oxidoreductase [Candidatus Acetothermia bacterium]
MSEQKSSVLSSLEAVKYLFRKPKTIKYPFELKEPALRYRGFHLNDWDACTGCGNCEDICPNDAIEMVEVPDLEDRPAEGMTNRRPQINYGRCCFCGLCVDICPAGSLSLSRDYLHIHFNTDTFTFVPKDEKSAETKFLPEEEYSVLKANLNHRRQDYEGFSQDLDFSLFEPERVRMPQVPPEERKLSFIEQVVGYTKEEASREAARCMECGLCEDACPAGLNIVDYVGAIYEDDPDESLREIFEDNPLPAICGRICMKHCEEACSLGKQGEPVAIRWLKRWTADVIEDYKSSLELSPAEDKEKRVGIIGAGPSGLSLAYFLRLKGYGVTVFDSLPGPGGAVRIGPPKYRLPLEAVEKDAGYIASLGVKFRYLTRVGKDVSFTELRDNYDAVYMAVGNFDPLSTGIENADRAHLALDFLKRNKIGEGIDVGREIIVIGGGNVAMDTAREALRLQHIQYSDKDVMTKTVSLEDWDEMPATDEEVEEAKEEGIQFNPAWGPKKIELDEEGNVRGLLCTKVKSVFDDDGRFNPSFHEDREKLLEGDMVIEAIGQKPDFSFIPEETFQRLSFTERRKVKVDEDGMTTLPGVFAGGDIVNSNLDAVTAIADAKVASEGIDHYLSPSS